MLNDAQLTLLHTKGVVVARVLLGFMFFFSGLGMLLNGPANSAMYFDSVGIPLAGLAVWVIIALKLAAGGALMAGKKVVEASLALIGFTILATLMVHMDLNDPGLTKNLAIIGGLLYAMAHATSMPSGTPEPAPTMEHNHEPHGM
jgi:putative oxidoreductase